MVEIPKALVDRYKEGRLIPFVGSGISSSVHWTDNLEEKAGLSWAALVDKAADLLGFPEPDLLRVRGSALQILEYYRLKNGDEVAELRNWFDQSMRAPDQALLDSPVIGALAKLAASTTFYTTNFDDFLERGLTLHGKPSRAIATELDKSKAIIAESAGDARAAVYKFHGDLSHPASMVLSERDYEKRLGFLDVQDLWLKADLLGRAVLFIGYSFSDWNVTYLFRLMNDIHEKLPESATGRRAYIAFPDPSEFEYSLFRARNVEVIPIRSSHREADLTELLLGLTK